MRRRTFLKNTAIGMGAFAGTGLPGLRAEGLNANGATGRGMPSESSTGQKIGRPVRIVSIGFKGPTSLGKMAEHVDEEGSQGPDVIVLPELCRGQDKASEEPLHGPTVTALAALAKKHKTYIAVPIDRRDGNRRLNSVALLDRSGQVVSVYDKVFPYWSEYDVRPSVSPGEAVQVHQADFGRVGFATCFDANFPEVWKRLSDEGAELVIWPSAYSAGISLQAHAINHHYYIVSCSETPDCIAYDITGEQLFYRGGKDINISRITLDLDRAIYHENFNIPKRDKLLSDRSQDVVQEKWMKLEQWFVLKAKRPGVSARELGRQYGLEELRHYIDRSRLEIDRRRGWEFAEKVIFPDKNIGELKALALETEIGKPRKTSV
ncbi:MAG: carbon-nitrogen hydrolase family protein [Terriglobia bacterium]